MNKEIQLLKKRLQTEKEIIIMFEKLIRKSEDDIKYYEKKIQELTKEAKAAKVVKTVKKT